MRAVAVRRYLPIEDPESLLDVEFPVPTPEPHDLRVRVEAVSVNPLDVKVRATRPNVEERPRVLGWDAAGFVDAVGAEVGGFQLGDRVYYAGSIARSGSNAELHLVDHRLVAPMPRSLDFADAAALPLTGLTGWEGLFERIVLDPEGGANRGHTLLVIGGAGGVGSMVIQLAKAAGLVVLATASRPETRAWVGELGADVSLDHRHPLRPQLEATGRSHVDAIFDTQSTEAWWETMADLIAPEGRIVGIVETGHPLDLDLLKSKSASFSWEFMFTRSLHATNMAVQGDILRRLAAWVDTGKVRTTRREIVGRISAHNLREAHRRIESGKTIGKIVLAGWG
ncbi:MAG: zinc-binding alcohol dehydrogenase family protein [Polyangiaceae bacterium]